MTITITKRSIANVAALILLLLIGWRHFGGGGIPGPGPGPNPPPIVDPVVDPKPGSWIIVIEERSDRAAIVAELVNDADFASSLTARGLKFRLYDQDDPDARAVREATGGMPRPTLLITDATGRILAKDAMPTTMESLDAAIKEATGL